MTRDADVVVIGGGAMGSAAAWQLAGRGADVILLEQYEQGHVRGASHGASRIFRLSYPDPVHIALAREAQRLWRELEDRSGVPLLTITGGVSHGGSPLLDRLHAGLVANGVASRWLPLPEAAARWPGLRLDTRALFHPDTGRLHADHAVAALQEVAAAQGAIVRHQARVDGIAVAGPDRVEVRTGSGHRLRARRAVVAAGAWTARLLAGLLPLPPLRVTQEQPAHFRVAPPRGGGDAGSPTGPAEADWPAFGHLFAPGTPGAGRFFGGSYGLATPGEGVKVGFHGVGPVVDPDRRDFQPRPKLAAALEQYVRAWLPGLDPATAVPISCTYTTTPDRTFVLDRQGPLVVAAGFSGEGFKFVPAIGRVLADLALDGQRPDPVFSFRRRQEVRS